MASITFDDGSGSATISPVSSVARFNGWTVPDEYVGEAANAVGDGRLYQWPSRVDYKATFTLADIPYSDQAKLGRFLKYANNGGLFTVTTDDLTSNVYTSCQVAPGTRIELSPPDPETLTYTLTATIVDMSVSPAPLLCQYE